MCFRTLVTFPTSMYVCMYVCMYVRTYLCICVYVCMHYVGMHACSVRVCA